MQLAHHRADARRSDYGGERFSQQFSLPESRLQQQAGSLLCDRSSLAAFQSRMSPSCNAGQSIETAAHQVRGENCARDMNANTDQISQMLQMNPVSELFDALKNRDREEALRFAEKNHEVQTHALHSDDLVFSQELRLRITGKV